MRRVRGKWWLPDPGSKTHEAVFAVATAIAADQAGRRSKLAGFAEMYEDKAQRTMSVDQDAPSRVKRVSYNVIRSCVDTASAKIARNKPRALVLTDEGDFSLQRKGKLLTRFLDGLTAQIGLYEEGQEVFRDAAIGDGGALRCYRDGDKLGCERVMPHELLVDEREAYYGKPRQMMHRRIVPRDVLIGMFPDMQEEIENAEEPNPLEFQGQASYANIADMVEVLEAWHLPSVEGGKDGRHVICTTNATLLEEDYKKDHFPFVMFYWAKPRNGFWGSGIAEELAGIQAEINELLRRIRLAQKLMCVPRVFLPRGANVDKAHINNEIGAIIEFDGMQEPKFSPALAIPPEVYKHLQDLYQRAYELTGVGQLSAVARKPAGLESGVALREYNDIESERFIIVGQRYEEFYMKAAEVLLDLARDMYSDGVEIKVKAASGRFIKSIPWRDVDMEKDAYSMRIFPVSLLPSLPAGKFDKVVELVQNGFVDKEHALRLLDFPDVEDFVSLKTAALDDIRMVLDSMCDGGDYVPPEPQMDLELAKREALSTLLRSKTRKLPEPVLDNLRTFLDELSEMTAPLEQAGPMGPPPGPPGLPPLPPMDPMAPPGAPPMGPPPGLPPMPPPGGLPS